jgi:hypothetical protein
MRRFALPHSHVNTVSSPNLCCLSGTYAHIGCWRSAQDATFADRLKPGLTRLSASAGAWARRRGVGEAAVMWAASVRRSRAGRRRTGTWAASVGNRAPGRRRTRTWAASVGQIARRRTEEERAEAFFLCDDDDGGGSQARLREQQAQTKGRKQPPKKLAWAPPSMSCRGPLSSRS